MNKRFLLIAAVAGLISFAASFAAGWLTGPSQVASAAPQKQPPEQNSPSGQIPPPVPVSPMMPGDEVTVTRSLTEQQLKDLVFEIRQKIKAYDRKLLDLDKREERVQTAQQTLNNDIEALNALRVELAASVADLKSERDALRKTQVRIEQVEKANLLAIAAAYDTMDSVRASEILINMTTSQAKNSGSNSSSIDDAIKILYYMQDRTKAKVLAEIVTTEPALAAMLSQRLKHITEGN